MVRTGDSLSQVRRRDDRFNCYPLIGLTHGLVIGLSHGLCFGLRLSIGISPDLDLGLGLQFWSHFWFQSLF